MRFVIKHELKGRLRIHAVQRRMTCSEADTLSWFLEKQENITSVKVYERTADAVICYTGEKEDLIMLLKQFRYSRVEVPENISASSGRRLNTEYKEKLITKVILHYSSKLFLPYPVRGGVHGPEIGEIYLGRDPVPATGENRSAGTGCCGDRSVCPSGGYQYGRFRHVPPGRWRDTGRVDAQKICGRSGTQHVSEHKNKYGWRRRGRRSW